jgi:hypothetical protein
MSASTDSLCLQETIHAQHLSLLEQQYEQTVTNTQVQHYEIELEHYQHMLELEQSETSVLRERLCIVESSHNAALSQIESVKSELEGERQRSAQLLARVTMLSSQQEESKHIEVALEEALDEILSLKEQNQKLQDKAMEADTNSNSNSKKDERIAELTRQMHVLSKQLRSNETEQQAKKKSKKKKSQKSTTTRKRVAAAASSVQNALDAANTLDSTLSKRRKVVSGDEDVENDEHMNNASDNADADVDVEPSSTSVSYSEKKTSSDPFEDAFDRALQRMDANNNAATSATGDDEDDVFAATAQPSTRKLFSNRGASGFSAASFNKVRRKPTAKAKKIAAGNAGAGTNLFAQFMKGGMLKIKAPKLKR